MTIAMAVIVPVSAWQWWQGSIRAENTRLIGRALADLEAAEHVRDRSSALQAADQALAIAVRSGLDPPGGLASLQERRDAIAQADAADRLASLRSKPPDRALSEAQAIADWVASDPALQELGDRVDRAITEAAGRWVDDLLALARLAEDSGDHHEAMILAERLASGLKTHPTALVAEPRRRVQDFAAGLIALHGVRIDPAELTRGPDVDPESDDITDVVQAARDGLRRRGYLVFSPDSPLADEWADAPYRFEVTLVERRANTYLQSPHQTTIISADLALDRGGETIWQDSFESRTRVPLPGLGAMAASRFLLSSNRDPGLERRLARDARDNLIEKLRLKLNSLPSTVPDPRR